MKLSSSQKRYLETATSHYAQYLPHAQHYLAARGIPLDVATTFRLGVVLEPLVGDEDYAGRLTVPYLTPHGVVDLRFRSLGDQTPKYLSRPNAQTRLFNVPALLSDSDVIAVCEGELDTIVMHALVAVPAVGVPGASNWREHYRLLLEDFERVLVMCDGDQAGRDFGRRVAGEVDGAATVHLPDGMDVNDLYMAEGPEGLRKRMGL